MNSCQEGYNMEHYSVKLDNGDYYDFKGKLLASGTLAESNERVFYSVYYSEHFYLLRIHRMIGGEEITGTIHPEYSLGKIIRIVEFHRELCTNEGSLEDFEEFIHALKALNNK